MITAIYAHYVHHTPITFDLEVPSAESWRERRAAALAAGHPWLVAEDAGEPVGYATGGRFRAKAAYEQTVETTVYLAPGATGRGLGRGLYEALLAELEGSFHVAVAGVTLPNPASVALHERCGFSPVGVFAEVGRKFGAWHDVAFYARRL